jgi:gliding motility-associated-like protein
MNKSLLPAAYKIAFLSLFLVSFLNVKSSFGQCAILPPILGQGSNKVPNGLCAPVTAQLDYSIRFSANLPAGNTYRVHFEWNDGQLPAETPVLLTPGSSTYNVSANRAFPANSDCEYQVRMIMRVNGAACASTIQFQRIASWRTDAFNGGNIRLISPLTGTNIHEVCEGVATSVVFNDLSVFNCNSQYPVSYTPGGPFIETPNEQIRWQQITYNTPNGPARIPNTRVNGVAVTNTEPPGGDLILNYNDPRVSATQNAFGVFQMSSPVVINDPRRRPTLTITAPGGFGAGFPDLGDEIEITIRYWNFCNPYANDFDLTPVSGNNQNGDNPPVVATAYIRIIDAPAQPTAPGRDICVNDSRTLSVTAPLGAGFTYRWWTADPNLGPATQVATGSSFTPGSGGGNGQINAGQRKHWWVTVESTAAGTCRSQAREVILTRRSALTAPTPISGPGNLCPNSSYTFSVPTNPPNVTITDAITGNFVLGTEHLWTVPAGWTIDSGQGSNSINVTTGGGTGAGSVTVTNRYATATTSGSQCDATPATTLAVNVRARPTVNISPDPVNICQGTSIQLNGNPAGVFGSIASHTWGDVGGILDATNVQQPNILAATPAATYALTYQVVADYGGGVFCASAVDNSSVVIDAQPTTATVGADQNLCQALALPSGPLGGNVPGVGIGQWSKQSGPGTITFNPSAGTANATATASQAGIYIVRWTISNGTVPCTSFEDVRLDFGQPPAAPTTGVAQDVCGLVVTLNGSTPTFETGTWSQTAGPGTTSFTPNANTPGATATASLPGAYTYRWRFTSGTCAPTDAFVTHTFRNPPTVSAPADFISCFDNPPTAAFNISLSGTFGGGATQARWEVISGSGTFASSGAANGLFDATSPVDDVYRPSVADFGAGTIQVRLITDDPTGGCTAVSDPVTITVDRLPSAAAAGGDFSTCNTSEILSATPANNGGTGSWSTAGWLYYENFENFANGFVGPDNGLYGWSRNITGATLTAGDYFEVQNGKFSSDDTDGTAIWNSNSIDISAVTSIDISVDLTKNGDLETSDFIEAWYVLDGVPTKFGEISRAVNDVASSIINTTATVTALNVSANNTLVIRILVNSNSNPEIQEFDNVLVRENSASPVTISDIFNPTATVSNLPVGATTLTWTVSSALGACSPSMDQVIITRNPQPAAIDPTPSVCEDFGSPGDATITPAFLTTLSATVNAGIPTHTVLYYPTSARTPGTEITANFIVNSSDQIFTRVTNTDVTPMCTQDGVVTFTVLALPPAANPTLLSRTFCEDVQGSGSHAGVNLASYNAQINGGAVTITWFPTLADAQAGTNQIMPGAAVGQVGNYTVFDGTPVVARVVNASSCANFLEVFPVVNPLPANNLITGNDVDCSSTTAVKVYQANAALNAFGTTHVYNWTINGAGTNFEVFDGSVFVTTNNYTITQSSFLLLVRFPNPGTFTFTVSETIDGCTGNVVNKVVNISGAPPALAFNAPPTQVCKGQLGVTYSLTTAPQAGSNYVWTVVGGSVVGPSSGNITSITVNWGTATAPQPSVSVTESNASGCAGAPASVNVFLNDIPVMVSPNSATICSGAAPSSQLTFSATLGGGPPINPITFNWTVVSVPANVTGVVNGQIGNGQLGMNLSNVSGVGGIVTFEVTPVENDLPNPPNCTSTPQTVFITVDPQPIINPGQTKLICSNTAVAYSIQVTPALLPATTTFSWAAPTMSAGGPQGVAQPGIALGAAGTIHITDNLTNSTNGVITATYNVIPHNGTCTYPAVPVVISIEPIPTMVATLTSLPVQCNGSNVNFNLTSPTVSNTPSDIKWDVTVTQTGGAGVVAGTAFANLANQAFIAGAATLSGTLTNNGNNAATVRFVFTPKIQGSSSCPGVALAPIDVVVEPSPNMARTLTTASKICDAGIVNFDLTTITTPNVASDIKWDVTVTQTSGTGVVGGTAFSNLANQTFTAGASTLNGTLTNSGNDAATVRFVFTPKLQGTSNCLGTSLAPVDIIVEPSPNMTSTLSTASTICNGGVINFDLTTLTTPNTAGDIKWDVTVTQTSGAGVVAGTAFANLTNQSFAAGTAVLNGTLTNSGNNAATVQFVFTPKLQGTSNCAGVSLAPIDVVVEPSVGMTRTLTTASTICDGGGVNFDLTTLTTPSTAGDIKWDVTVTQTGGAGVVAGTAFANLTNQVFAAGSATLNGTLTNSGNNAAIVRFVFTPKLQGSSNCAGIALAPVDIVVEPTPIMARTLSTSATMCSAGTVNFNLTTTTAPSVATDIKWDVTVAQIGGSGVVSGTAFSNLTNQSFTAGSATLNGTLTNNGNDPATVQFIFTPKLQGTSGCPGVALAPINVIVEPLPMMTRTLTTPSTICNGDLVNFDLTSATASTSGGDIKWDVTVTQIGGSGIISGTAFSNLTDQSFVAGLAILNGTLLNSGINSATVRFVFTPKLQGTSNCAGVALAPIDVVIEPSPAMTRTLVTGSTICNAGIVTFNLATTTSPSVATDIKWDVAITQIGGSGVVGGSGFTSLSNQIFTGGAAVFSGNLTNNGNDAATVRYVFTPKLQGTSNCPIASLTPIDVVVEPVPTMARTLTTSSTICNGGNINFDLTTVTVPNLTSDIKWDVTVTKISGGGVVAGTAFSNLTNQSFTAGVASLNGTLTNNGNDAATVRFVFTPKLQGSSNCAGVALAPVDVVVEPTPVMTRTLTSPSIICDGGNVNFTLATVTTPSVAGDIKWNVTVSQISGTGIAAGTAFANLTNQTFIAGSAMLNGSLTNSGNNVATVRFVFTPILQGSSNCTGVALAPIDVLVEPTPIAVLGNSTPKVCNNGNVNILISSPTSSTVPADLLFDLTVSSTNAGATGGSAFTSLANQSFPILIGGTLTNSSDNFITVTFTVTPKLQGTSNCVGIAPAPVNVIIEPTPKVAATNNQPRLCNGGTPDISITTVTSSSIPANLTFDIIPSLPPGITGTGDAASGVTSVSAPFSLNTGTLSNSTNISQIVVYTITPKLSGCVNGASQTVNVIVEPTPQVSLTNNLAKICNGGTPNITVTSPSSPSATTDLTFDVVVTLPVGVSGTGIAGNGVLGATAPFSINAGTITNTNSNFETVTYTVTPKLNGCANGPTQMVNVIVEPTPVATPTNNLPTICNGGTPDITISSVTGPSVPANLTFDVTVSLPAGVTGTGVAGSGTSGASAPFSINTGTLSNSTSVFKTVTYTITPKLSGCANGTPQVVSVIVEPTPAATFVNNNPSICSGESPSIDITSLTSPSVPGNLTFDVAVSLPAGVIGTGVAATGLTGATAPFSINTGTLTHDNLSNANLIVTYTITPKLAGCADGTPQLVNVTVRPIPVGALDNSRIVCSDEAFTYNIQTANINTLGNGVTSVFTYTVSSSDEANVPTPIGLDRTVASNAVINGNFNNANLAGADVDITYTITPFNSSGSCPGVPFDVVVRIRPEPTAPATTTVQHCSDAVNPFVFDLQSIIDTGVGGNSVPSNFSYTVSSTNPLAVFPEANKPVADAVPISHIYSNFSSNDVTITYVVTPFSIAGNCQGTNFQFKIIVHPEPVGTNVNDPVCSRTLNHNIQGQITNGLASIFTYTVSSDNVGVPPGPDRVLATNAPITDIYTNGTGSPANITYTITPFNAANPTCGGTPFTYTVNVSPNPIGVSDTKSAKCSDFPFIEDPQNNIVPAVASTFSWNATYDLGITGGLNNGNGVISETLHNETAGQLFAHYTVIPTAGTCIGAPFFIDIPIDAEPVMLPGLATPPAVCSTNSVSTTAIGVILDTNGVSIAAAKYMISIKSIDPGLVPTPGNQTLPGTFLATSPSAGRSDAISLDSYRNTTSAQLNVVYTVIPISAANCNGDAFDITVKISPEPVLETPVWPDVCSSNTGVSNPVNIVLGTNTASANAVSYQLVDRQYSNGGPFGSGLPIDFTPNGGNAVIMASPGSINLIKGDKFNNKSTVPVTVRYTIQGFTSQGCKSELLDYDVVVNPEPDLFVPAPGLVCSDVTTGITLTEILGSATATSFNINNIIKQAGLVAGGSNASIGLLQSNSAIFNDIFTNTTSSSLTVTYKIAPVTAAGCVGAEKDIVITITPAPAVSSNLNKIVCSDAPSTIILATEATSPIAGNYRIDNIILGGALGDLVPNGSVNLATPRTTANLNEISGDRFVNTTNNPLTVTYRITPIGSAAPFCEGPFRDVVLTVEPTIVAVPVNTNTDICSATPTDILLTSPSVPTSPTITYNYIAVSSIGGQMTGFIPALNNLPAGYRITDNLVNNSNSSAFVTYTVTAVSNGAANGAGCSSVGVPVVVNVEPKPKLTASPLVQTVCESDGVNVSPTNILLTSTTIPSAGTLQFNVISAVPTGGMTLQPATSPLKTTYLKNELIVDQWNNPTLTDQTVTYTLRPVVSGGLACPGDDVVVTITVKPRPIISPVAPVTVCSGEFRSIPLTLDIAGTFATWTVSAPGTITGAINGGGSNLDITLFNTGFSTEVVTYTVTPKFNNCDGIPTSITVNVNPTPNVVGLPPTVTVCDGATLNVPLSSPAAGTIFDWVVTDVFNLEAPGFYDGSGTTINQVINNPNGFQAVLIYQVTPRTVPGGCVGQPKIMNVNVGSIVANVTPDQTSICSGGRVQMTNSSLGATSHRWFYRVQGTTTEIDVRATPFVNYQLANTTATNPLIYEIVYEPSNGLCTVPPVVTPIEVYRNVTAGFNEGTIPPFVGGNSTVTYTNTSVPVDATQFRYEWTFGLNSTPLTAIGAGPFSVNYSTPGVKNISLRVINIAAETAGLGCESTFSKTINIPLLPLIAAFKADPQRACFPSDFTVTENTSTGDIMEWRVVDSNGRVAATSNAALPVFRITSPGSYSIFLTTSNSLTGQVANTQQSGFEVFDNPVASFDLRPNVVFVPDTELTTFNFSTGTTDYDWDFGDGGTSFDVEPKYVYKVEGVYDVRLIARNDHGQGLVCTDTLIRKVTAKQGGVSKVPNAFTPNPNGPSGGSTGPGGSGTFNDVFLPIVKGAEEFNMQIFDRWGNLIFESNSANVGWDGYDKNGRLLPAGVFVYKLTIRLSDGQRSTQIGDVTMIR